MSWSSSSSKEKTEIIKNGFDIAIKFSIAALIALCVIVPDFVRIASKHTGLNVVALASGKIEPYAEKIEQLSQQLSETTSIVEIQQKAINTARASNPTGFNDGLTPSESSQLGETLKRVISRNETIIATSSELARQAPVDASATVSWGVVAGGDRKIEAANDEVKWLKTKGYSATLFQRQGWYRTVATFRTRNDAYDALATIRQRSPTAYPVDISKWCPGRVGGPTFDSCPGDEGGGGG